MSAIRGTDRRAVRNVHSSPYAAARPLPKKKSSSWSFGISGILSYINPLRLRRSADHVTEEAEEGEGDAEGGESESNNSNDAIMQSPNDFAPPTNHLPAQNPAASLAARGRQLANSLNDPPSPNNLPNPGLTFSTPPRAAANSFEDANLSPAESLDKVQKFLREKSGQALSEWETRGLLTFLEKSAHIDDEEDKPEPFRFSSSPSRTPARGNSPVFVFGVTATTATPVAPNADRGTPRKTLSKNPNGVYRWQGGGSAKPRNRYQSPSFGVRSPAPTIKLTPAKTEGKRRRIDEAESSSSGAVPFPAVSPQKPTTTSTSESALTSAPSQSRASVFPSVNSASSSAPKTSSNTASTPRLRTSGLPTKPTAPPIPSPLRQAWGQNDSPPQTPKPNGPTPTKAANFMAELIKEVTPAKKPDLSNPYQTASPVKPPTKKPVVKKPRAQKPPVPAPEPDKGPEPSPQAIIEATLPKGSKRSRPPADLAKSTRSELASASLPPAPGLRGTRQTLDLPPTKGDTNTFSANGGIPMVVEEVADEQDDDVNSRKRRKTPVKEPTVTVEEIADVDIPTSKSSTLLSQPTEIIEPDNAGSSSSKTDHTTTPTLHTPTSPTKSSSLFGLKSSAPKEPSKLRFSYQADKTEAPLSPLTFSPAGPASVPPVPPAAPKPTAASLPGPILTDSKTTLSADPKQTVLAMSVHDLPTYIFPSSTFAAPTPAHEAARHEAKSAIASSLPTYDFTAPLPKTPASVSSKPAAAPVLAFNWSAAGMKAPAATGADWTCSSCMLSNPASATDKCTICDASR